MPFSLPLLPQKPGPCHGRMVSATAFPAEARAAGRRARPGCHFPLGLGGWKLPLEIGKDGAAPRWGRWGCGVQTHADCAREDGRDGRMPVTHGDAKDSSVTVSQTLSLGLRVPSSTGNAAAQSGNQQHLSLGWRWQGHAGLLLPLAVIPETRDARPDPHSLL